MTINAAPNYSINFGILCVIFLARLFINFWAFLVNTLRRIFIIKKLLDYIWKDVNKNTSNFAECKSHRTAWTAWTNPLFIAIYTSLWNLLRSCVTTIYKHFLFIVRFVTNFMTVCLLYVYDRQKAHGEILIIILTLFTLKTHKK